MAKIFHLFETKTFLSPRPDRRMIAHQWSKHSQGKPAKQQISRGICPKSSQICSNIQKSTHIQGWQHFQIQQNMGPPGLVISGPDSSIAMHSDIGRSGKDKKTFIRLDPIERLSSRPCHVVAKQIMHFIMADSLPAYLMIERFIIRLTVSQTKKLISHLPCRRLFFPILQIFYHLFTDFLDSFWSIKNRRFIHIIPKTLDPLIRQ